MTSKREQIALILAAAVLELRQHERGDSDKYERPRDIISATVDAIFDELREPTEEMVEKMYAALVEHGEEAVREFGIELSPVWQAGIDAAREK